MADNVLIHDSADRVPPAPAARHPLTAISGADFVEPPRRRPPVQFWIMLTAIAAGLVVWAVVRLDQALRDFFDRFPWLADTLIALLLLAAIAALAVGVAALAGRLWLGWQHARLIRTRMGVPVDLLQQLTLDPFTAEAQAIELEGLRAPYAAQAYLSTSSTSSTSKAGDALALPAPDDGASNRLTFDQFWQRLQDAAHVGLFGMSQAGKTTIARALMNHYIEQGDQVMGISLAADRGDWPIEMIGAAGEPAIVVALDRLRDELRRRESEGLRDQARPLRIFVDELTSATADRDVYEAWSYMMRAFMTRSRHVNMFLVVMAHDNTSGVFASAGAARLIQNFLQVWAVREGDRRLVRIDDGRTFDERGRVVRRVWQLDDTAPIVELARRRPALLPDTIWLTESDLDRRSGLQAIGTFSGGRSGPSVSDGAQPDDQKAKESIVCGLKRQGKNREQIRQALTRMGLTLDNNEYGDILARNGLN